MTGGLRNMIFKKELEGHGLFSLEKERLNGRGGGEEET